MADRHTLEELNNCSRDELITIVLMMQGQLDTLNENIERLIEQVRIPPQIGKYKVYIIDEVHMLPTVSLNSLRFLLLKEIYRKQIKNKEVKL